MHDDRHLNMQGHKMWAELGFKILAQAREETGLPIVTEVMDPRLVPLVAQYADVLQIGARNMQNYQLLEEVGRTGMPVLLKRGLSATIEEWLQASNYLTMFGNENVILCERGSSFGYDNLVVDMLGFRQMSEVSDGCPVIFDVTHALQMPGGRADSAGGRRQQVPAISGIVRTPGADVARAGTSIGTKGGRADAGPSLPCHCGL